ncbi:hypothetical protein ZIOFF_064845 [Zingiber officinale]|uniref:non-specific serine/threonine protein kinase n=1 Tax=Zingiber officinale TaxID=94328 RepID=A0A8J5EZ92_ZINOF|nr:hypothetical protein ZIOFF_064845 [Zingiber officinale]
MVTKKSLSSWGRGIRKKQKSMHVCTVHDQRIVLLEFKQVDTEEEESSPSTFVVLPLQHDYHHHHHHQPQSYACTDVTEEEGEKGKEQWATLCNWAFHGFNFNGQRIDFEDPKLEFCCANRAQRGPSPTEMASLVRRMLHLLAAISCFLFAAVEGGGDDDLRLLMEFKSNLVDAGGNLSNWSPSESNPCLWDGIACFQSEVTSINLHKFGLQGFLTATICRLPYLTIFNVSSNMISGSIPKDLAQCRSLEILDLSTNMLHGEIPQELCALSSLTKLFLSENYLFGVIPSSIGNLTMLEELVIYSNNLTGAIPPSIKMLKNLRIIRAGLNDLSGPVPVEISECDNLEVLGLAQNRLEGVLPKELERLKNLTTLVLWQNQLSGEIPPELGNCSNLEMIALNNNFFTGGVPKELGKLILLKKLYLYTNRLDGTIPKELGNCQSAVEIDLSENHLTGIIPKELGLIQTLHLLYLFENLLQGSIPRELGQLSLLRKIDLSINNLTGIIPLEFQNFTSLENLQLFNNNLEGIIPPLLGTKSNLLVLDLSDNKLTGSIPSQLCKYQKLILLSLGSNRLFGNIPHGVKTCMSLIVLRLGGNLLTGSLPLELSGLLNLTSLEMNHNRFSGPVTPEIGKLKNLERLLLSNNYFFGEIPPEIGELTALVSFNVSSNHLSGGIPQELANCKKLQRLDLSRNHFSGIIPREIGNLVNLELLLLSDNHLNGTIPDSLGGLYHLTELQLGGNNLSGGIPDELGQLTALQIALNVSYNSLSGEIPSGLGNLQMLETLYLNNNQLDGELPASFSKLSSLLVCNLSYNYLFGSLPNTPVFRSMDDSNFLGNYGLCGSGTKACQPSPVPLYIAESGWVKRTSKEKIVSISAVVVGLISLVLTIGLCWSMKYRLPVLAKLEEHKQGVSDLYYLPCEGVTYQEILKATDDFSESAVIGKGACGTVYKAVMLDGGIIAVKKLKSHVEGSSIDSSFRAEISTLGNVRHRNIVKLYGFCYHQDSNLILYEYMANGSLGEMLHGSGDTCLLDWNTRYRIALGAAEGLRYLHYDCKPQIIHRDIKSNNILLDETMEAHVGDFGLAKLIDISHSKTMSAVAGSYGYIAPEYAFTMKVTEKCDIYSFGVVLLELVTGKSPIQPIEQGGDLVNLVRRSVHNNTATSNVFDSRLDLTSKSTMEEMSLVLKIALFSTNDSPFDRPTMRDVIAMLMDVRGSICFSPSSPSSETPLDQTESPRDFTDSDEIQSVALEPLGLWQVLIFGYFDLGISDQRLRENDWHHCSSDDPASAVKPSGRIPPAVTWL